MNLDSLQQKWSEQDRKLDQVMRLNATVLREIQLSKARHSLQWLIPGVLIELLLTIVAVIWLGDFIVDHLRQWQFYLPALILDVSMILLMGSCIRQLLAIRAADYGAPVVVVQKELEKLRVLRIRTTKWVFTLSFLLWAPATIVLFRGLLGVNIYEIANAIQNHDSNFFAWIIANLLFGAVVFVLMLWGSRRYAGRFQHLPLVKGIMDDFAGQNLMKALRSLDAIKEFEAEPHAGETR